MHHRLCRIPNIVFLLCNSNPKLLIYGKIHLPELLALQDHAQPRVFKHVERKPDCFRDFAFPIYTLIKLFCFYLYVVSK